MDKLNYDQANIALELVLLFTLKYFSADRSTFLR